MKTSNYSTVEANSSHDLRVKIGRDQIKKLKAPDTNKMISLRVPSLRLTYYFKTLTRCNKRIKELRKVNPDIQFTQKGIK